MLSVVMVVGGCGDGKPALVGCRVNLLTSLALAAGNDAVKAVSYAVGEGDGCDKGQCIWKKFSDKYIPQYADGNQTKFSMAGAKTKCLSQGTAVCGGITCNRNWQASAQCTVRSPTLLGGSNLQASSASEDTPATPSPGGLLTLTLIGG